MIDVPFLELSLLDRIALRNLACGVVADLVDVLGELAMVEAQETRARLDGYGAGISAGLSDSAARKEGDRQAKELIATRIEVEARKNALIEAKFLIYKLLDHGDN